jgi:hypothetical protein
MVQNSTKDLHSLKTNLHELILNSIYEFGIGANLLN